MAPIERLNKKLAGRDEDIGVAEAALLLLYDEYPQLDVPAYLARLDSMAAELRRRLRPDISPADAILALNRYLFDELGFTGSTEDYYDPRNSFVNEVLDRKIGIPITLAIVYLHVGRALGLPLQGVSFPGHFLVKCAVRQGYAVIDPYYKGVTLSMHELQQRLGKMQGGESPSKQAVAALLGAASNREILTRMLRNLKSIYLHFNQLNQVLSVCDRLLLVAPEQADEVRDRAAVYLQLECFRAALADFQHYLELKPGADDAEAIRVRIVELQQTTARLN